MLRFLGGALAVLLAFPAVAQERVVDVASRPGVTVRVLAAVPPNPAGTVVLQTGGDGILNIADNGRPGALSLNQVVRSRGQYVAAGFATVVPDIPPDLRQTPNFLTTAAHANDLGAVVAFARTLAEPVYFVATSNGAISAVAVMTLQSRSLPDALVITSGVLVSLPSRMAADRVGDLTKIKVPVLLLSHTLDECPLSAPGDRIRFRALLTAAPRVDLQNLTGGTAVGLGFPAVCDYNHYHGFNGIDDKVTAAITAWIKSLPR